jgi:hypothetical protein
VLAAQQLGHLCRQASEDDVLGVDDVPPAIDFAWLRGVRAHGGTFFVLK